MTQVKPISQEHGQIAQKFRGRARTLAERRADLEAQMRRHIAAMGLLDDLTGVRTRLHGLRKELARSRGVRNIAQWRVAQEIDNIPPRTFQSWENGEVETDGDNYAKIAAWYSKQLGREITKNYILYGSDEEPAPVEVPPPTMAREPSQLDRIEEKLDDVLRRLSPPDGVDLLPDPPPPENPPNETDDDEEATG